METSEKAIEAIWRKAQRVHSIRIPKSVRQAINADINGQAIAQQETLINLAVRSIKLAAEDRLLPTPKKQKTTPHKTQRGPNSRITQKRLQIVNFIMNKHFDKRGCLDRSCTPKTRYNWKELKTSWNDTYPSYDPMTPNRLKWAFNNAIDSKEVMKLYHDQFIDKEAVKIREERDKILHLFIEGMADRQGYMGSLGGMYHALCQINELLPDKYKGRVFHNVDELNAYNEGVLKEREAKR